MRIASAALLCAFVFESSAFVLNSTSLAGKTLDGAYATMENFQFFKCLCRVQHLSLPVAVGLFMSRRTVLTEAAFYWGEKIIPRRPLGPKYETAKISDLTVRVGFDSVQEPARLLRVSDVIPYYKYPPPSPKHNIALLIIDNADNGVEPPYPDLPYCQDDINVPVRMFGFGLKDNQHNEKEGIVPTYTDVVIMNPTECFNKYGDLFDDKNEELICSLLPTPCTEPDDTGLPVMRGTQVVGIYIFNKGNNLVPLVAVNRYNFFLEPYIR